MFLNASKLFLLVGIISNVLSCNFCFHPESLYSSEKKIKYYIFGLDNKTYQIV